MYMLDECDLNAAPMAAFEGLYFGEIPTLNFTSSRLKLSRSTGYFALKLRSRTR